MTSFAHLQFDLAALAAQRDARLGGDLTAYAGVHFFFGFHEDGAAILAARRIG